jgi:hypothetical protein
MKWIAIALLLAAACGGSSPPPKGADAAPGGSKDPSKWPADDRTMCDWRNKPELEVVETVGPGSIKPNVRRVFKYIGERDQRHKVLICREIDTNLDGLKDLVRTFNNKGEAAHEMADTNYDGKIDVWTDFVAGRISKQEEDTNFDGRVDVWKFYIDGQLSRIRRNTHCPNAKADTWEIYNRGSLERVGNDTNCDTHVDRWDRDTERIRAKEEEERRIQEQMRQSALEGGAPMVVGADGGVSEVRDAGAADAKK